MSAYIRTFPAHAHYPEEQATTMDDTIASPLQLTRLGAAAVPQVGIAEQDVEQVIAKQQSYSATSVPMGVSEIALRVFCTVSCVATLIASAVTLSAIDGVEDYLNDHGSEYKHANGYRRAAKWVLLVAVMGIIFHSLMIFIRCLYLKSYLESIFSTYAYLNAALCVVLGLSSFAGGVSNAIYAANNAEAINAISYTCDQSYDINADFCNALKRIRDAEIAAASMSFCTMVMFAVLVIVMISSGVMSSQETQRQNAEPSSPISDDTAAAGILSSSHVTSSYMPLNAPLYRPTDAPPPYTP